MVDNGDEVPYGLEADRIFPHAAAGAGGPKWHGSSWPHVLLGAVASVVLVAVIMLLDLGDRYDENGVRLTLSSFPQFWVCGALLVLVQVAVLLRTIYVRSRVWMVVALAALAIACWMVWRLAT